MMNEVCRCHASGYYVSWWDGHVWRQSFEKKCFHLSCHKLQSSSILYLPAQPETIGYAGTKIPQPRDLFLVHITRFQYVHKYLNILCNKGIFLSGLLQSKCLVCWDSVWDLTSCLKYTFAYYLGETFIQFAIVEQRKCYYYSSPWKLQFISTCLYYRRNYMCMFTGQNIATESPRERILQKNSESFTRWLGR